MERIKTPVVRFLRYTERYTKTDMLYLANGGFWLGIGQFAASGSAFTTSLVFANFILPDVYGVYKYIISVNSLLLITTLSGMDSAVTQSVSRGFDGTLLIAVKEKIKWGFYGSIISFVLSIYYFFQGNILLTVGFGITAIFLPFTESFDMYNSLLWGKKLFGVQTKYNILKKLIVLVLLLSIIILTKNIYLIIFIYFSSITFSNLYFYYKTKRKYLENEKTDHDAIEYGKKLSGVYIISLILGELDKILVFHYLGAIDLAVYSLAVAPTDQIKGLFKNVNSLAMPQFSQRTSSEIRKNIWNKVLLLGIASTAVIITYIISAPILFKVFFPKYLSSIIYSQVLSISLIPVIVAGFLYTVLESQKDTQKIYQYNLYSNIIGIIILVPLIYFNGLWGAIIARILNRLIVLVIGAGLINKKN